MLYTHYVILVDPFPHTSDHNYAHSVVSLSGRTACIENSIEPVPHKNT